MMSSSHFAQMYAVQKYSKVISWWPPQLLQNLARFTQLDKDACILWERRDMHEVEVSEVSQAVRSSRRLMNEFQSFSLSFVLFQFLDAQNESLQRVWMGFPHLNFILMVYTGSRKFICCFLRLCGSLPLWHPQIQRQTASMGLTV